MIYGELGAYLMSVFLKLRMINYWFKLINGKNSNLALIIYNITLLKSFPYLIIILVETG
jgi:hypothetical protein